MTRRAILVLMSLVFWATTGMAGDLNDSHLSAIPRTAEETARVAATVRFTADFSKPEPFEARPGGATTVPARSTPDAFSHPSANIDFEKELDFRVGNGLFRKNWVAAPASTLASDGLGPLYSSRACQDCHLKDGRGHPPEDSDTSSSMILALSIAGGASPQGIKDHLATLPDPTYGMQLQTRAAPGQAAEGKLTITYANLPVTFADGTVVTLRSPTYTVTDMAYGAMSPNIMLSPRVAPQMIGLGLLEAIPAADILALADEDDTDNDGISGRANVVWSEEQQSPMLGRFGMKAGTPTVRHQSAIALSTDMGLSSPLFAEPYGDCTANQPDCRTAPDGQEPGLRDGREVDQQSLDLITYYSRNLGVPARRNLSDAEVLAGKQVFYDIGCPACHQPKFVTNRLINQPEQSFQLIWPYSDLLLHDMGEGLADNRPEARATGREWRTAPLWGVGLTETVSGRSSFLHDGRARTLIEAILWHGGEAGTSRAAMIALPKSDRDTLIIFLESL
jgi:CxxC motif-containing protein (DUF1111 family)